MIALTAYPAGTLDESAREFIATFMSNVARVAGDGNASFTTLARVETLLEDALTGGTGGSARAWSELYQTIEAVVSTGRRAGDARRAHAYLRAFMRENGDLADD
jgi:hypothetical protein